MKRMYYLVMMDELINEWSLLKSTLVRQQNLHYKSYKELCDKNIFDSSYARIW
jgi:hypothetical protein